MDYIKEHFFNLSINRQIQVGIMTVSFSVCFLIFSMLTLNVYILLNMWYVDILKLFDDTETKQMELSTTYIDLKFALLKDFSRLGIQNIRNIYQNSQISNLMYNNVNYQKYVKIYDENEKNCENDKIFNCIIYKNFGNNDQTTNLNAIFFSFPFFQMAMNYRFILTTNISLYDQITFFNEQNNVFYTYPYTELNPNYNKNTSNINEINYFKAFIKNAYTTISNTSNPINFDNNLDLINITNLFIASPIIVSNQLSIKVNLKNYTGKQIFSTFSFNLLNISSIKDIIIGDFSSDIINQILFLKIKSIRRIIPILTFFKENQSVINDFNCKYIRRINDFYNNGPAYFSDYVVTNLSDCIMDKNTKKTFNSYYYVPNFTKIQFVKRQVKLSIIDYNFDSVTPYKITRIIHPDLFTKLVSNSDFFVSIYTFVYSILDPTITLFRNELLYYYANCTLFLTMYLNLTIWFFSLILIGVILYSVTTRISTPINKLIKIVVSIGKEDSQNTNDELDEINYPDDYEIDNFFNLCKNLVKGGFSDEGNKFQKNKFLSSAYYNISYIKINNVIIEEEKIESLFSEDAFMIFSYCREEDFFANETNKLKTIDVDKNTKELNEITDKTNTKTINMFTIDKSVEKFDQEINPTINLAENQSPLKSIDQNNENLKFPDTLQIGEIPKPIHSIDVTMEEVKKSSSKNKIAIRRAEKIEKVRFAKSPHESHFSSLVDDFDKKFQKKNVLNTIFRDFEYF